MLKTVQQAAKGERNQTRRFIDTFFELSGKQTRLMERSNSMVAKEKRILDPDTSEEGQPQHKRPALASVIVEALKVDSLQKLCSSLEPILRRVVSEEVERALAKLGPAPANLQARASPIRIENSDGKNLQLHFQTKLVFPLFTGRKLEGGQGANVHIILLDKNTGRIVNTGPESSIKVDIVVLEGDFNNEDEKGWSQADFESHIVREREGKRPLLSGELQVVLKEGVGTLGDISFTDNSSWIRSRKFRLGLRVASGFCEGIRIREAKTEAFTVKDHRGELYKKHYPPALSDEVWRLEKIGKDGSFHKKLNKSGIFTVEDFLRLVVRDSQRLRNILGSGMSNKMWDILVEHSKTCVLSGKLYIYCSDDARNVGVVFNNIYEFGGLIAGGQYHPADSLSDDQKVYVDTLVKKAYENWMDVVEYDGNSLSSFQHEKISSASKNDVTLVPQNYSDSYDSQIILPTLSVTLPLEPISMNPIGGHNLEMATRYSLQTQNMNLNNPIQFDGTSFSLNNQINITTQQAQPPRFENMNFDFFTEEDIRTRSHQMLENEDMQHLLRVFNMGNNKNNNNQNNNNQNSIDPSGDNYHYPSTPFIPNNYSNYGFENDQTRSSGKAVVGWLKLKAALRWGIFIRKKTAERRAQLVELDDL